MATVSTTNILNTLGAGSGINTQSLAQNLADAEISPRKDAINSKITKIEAKISGYGYLKTALNDLKNAFAKLDDASDFASITPANTQPAALGITTTSSAQAGSYSVGVEQLAHAQRTASNAFTARNASLNQGQPFTLDFSLNGETSTPITVSTDTPAGVVSAINGANLGIKAQLLQTGDTQAPYTIVVTGETGAAKNFALTSSDNLLSFSKDLQAATDAKLTVNGLSITRSSNQISDLIDGVTLNLYTTTSSPARLDLNRETTSIKENLKGLVTAYNDLETTLQELGNSKSKAVDASGSLMGDSILQTIRSQVRAYITDNASTPGSNIKAARDTGLSFDRNGTLVLDEARLDTALQNHFDEVVQAFSASSNNKSVYSTAKSGVAGDAVVKLDKMLRSTGLIANQTDSASKRIESYKTDLTKLDERLSMILERYTKQFSAMDAMVGQTNSLKTSLKSSFDGMMATYTKN